MINICSVVHIHINVPNSSVQFTLSLFHSVFYFFFFLCTECMPMPTDCCCNDASLLYSILCYTFLYNVCVLCFYFILHFFFIIPTAAHYPVLEWNPRAAELSSCSGIAMHVSFAYIRNDKRALSRKRFR